MTSPEPLGGHPLHLREESTCREQTVPMPHASQVSQERKDRRAQNCGGGGDNTRSTSRFLHTLRIDSSSSASWSIGHLRSNLAPGRPPASRARGNCSLAGSRPRADLELRGPRCSRWTGIAQSCRERLDAGADRCAVLGERSHLPRGYINRVRAGDAGHKTLCVKNAAYCHI
jgi:hypothetical protein